MKEFFCSKMSGYPAPYLVFFALFVVLICGLFARIAENFHERNDLVDIRIRELVFIE